MGFVYGAFYFCKTMNYFCIFWCKCLCYCLNFIYYCFKYSIFVFVKRLKKASLIVFAILLLILAVTAAVLFVPSVQTFVAKKMAQWAAAKAKTEMSIGYFEAYFLRYYKIGDFKLMDREGDTLLYFKELEIKTDSVLLSENIYAVKSIYLNQPVVKIKKLGDGTLNLDFISDLFAGGSEETQDTTGGFISAEKLSIHNGRFIYKVKAGENKHAVRFRPNHIVLDKINLEFERVLYDGNLKAELKQLSLHESCGLNIDSLSFSASQNGRRLDVSDFKLSTSYSHINIPVFSIDMPYRLGADLSNEKREQIMISKSLIAARDLLHFATFSSPADVEVQFSAAIQKRANRYEADNIRIRTEGMQLDAEAAVYEQFDSEHFYAVAKVHRGYIDRNFVEMISTFFPQKDLMASVPDSLNYADWHATISYMPDSTNFSGAFRTNLFSGNNKTVIKSLAGRQLITGELFLLPYQNHVFFPVNTISFSSLTGNYNVLNTAGKDVVVWADTRLTDLRYAEYIFEQPSAKLFMHNNDFEITGNIKQANLDLTAEINYTADDEKYFVAADCRKLAIGEENRHDSLIISGKLSGEVVGLSPNNMNGYLGANDLVFIRGERRFDLPAMILKASNEYGQQIYEFSSPYGNADLRGTIDFDSLNYTIQSFSAGFFPGLQGGTDEAYSVQQPDGVINLTVDLQNMKAINQFLFPRYNPGDRFYLEAYFNPRKSELEIRAESPNPVLDDNFLFDFNLDLSARGNDLLLTVFSKGSFLDGGLQLDHLYFESRIKGNQAVSVFSWLNTDSLAYAGDLSVESHFGSNDYGLVLENRILPTELLIKGKKWSFLGKSIDYADGKLAFDSVLLASDDTELEINGLISADSSDVLVLDFYNFYLDNLYRYVPFEGFNPKGVFRGKIALYNLFDSPGFDLAASVNSLSINNYDFGDLSLTAEHDFRHNLSYLNAIAFNGDNRFTLEGTIQDFSKIDFSVGLPELDMRVLHDMFQDDLDIYGGRAAGNAQIFGEMSNPSLSATLRVENLHAGIKYLNTDYQFSPMIALTDSTIEIFKTELKDADGNSGVVSGKIQHRMFEDISFDIQLGFERLLVLDTKADPLSDYYGTVYAGGAAHVYGDLENYQVDAEMETLDGTELTVSMIDEELQEDYDFIHFADADTSSERILKPKPSDEMTIDMLLEISPKAKFEIITDPLSGDNLSFKGSGLLQFKTGASDHIELTGDYRIIDGKYSFSMEELIGYEFKVKEGSSLKWNGLPEEAQLDIEALYPIRRVHLYDLLQEENARNVFVQALCHIYIGNDLDEPSLAFGVSTDEVQRTANSVLQNLHRDDINKQFLSLLLLKRFQPAYGVRRQTAENEASEFDASAFLVQQIGPLLSSVSENLDVGLKYNRETEAQAEEIEVDVSAGLFDNRVIVSGNVARGEYRNTDNTNLVGDFEVMVNLSADGRYRMRVFNTSNRNLLYSSSPYTQGIGFFFRSEFDSLFRRKKILKK